MSGRKRPRRAALLLGLLVAPAVARGATFYVRPTGNDAQDGRGPATAFATIGRAAAKAGGGDTVVVAPGVYAEGNLTPLGNGRRKEVVQFVADRDGSRTGSAPGEVVVDATGFPVGFRLSARPWVIVNGFTVTGAAGEGIAVKSGSDHSAVVNCVLVSNGGRGVWVRDSRDVVVFNNLVYANNGTGIDFGGDDAGSARGIAINNTVYGNGLDGIRVEGVVPSPRVTVVQNVIAQNFGRGINLKARSTEGFVGQWNLNVDGYGSEAQKAAFDFAGSPLLMDPSGLDQVLGADGRADDDFRLRQVLAGQAEQSSAVDASPYGTRWLGLTRASTHAGGMPDRDKGDLGFHYGNTTDFVTTFRYRPEQKIRQVRGRAMRCERLGAPGGGRARCLTSLTRLRRMCGPLAEALCG
jgi:parallel beta-helix repeat protein